ELNCVLTRVHWQQDRRVLDYCDRHGILIQLEVPTWGGGTFQGLGPGELETITRNGLDQLGEMIARDRNHPCVFSWGLCNEVDGQNPVAQEFVRRMLREAKSLDPGRLCSYASNSLQTTPERDVAGEMDFIEWNEYYESWYGGDPAAMRANLETIHRAFPDKPIVISEYGYCACTADRPENDPRRIEILRTRPVGSLEIKAGGRAFVAVVRTRPDLPAYTLRGYKLRWTAYGNGAIPLERGEIALPDLVPGSVSETPFGPKGPDAGRLLVEIVRPTGFSVASVRA
ncbi:MAG: hypothetical protein NTX99_06840, partial [Candidatus Aminicenantes bacterium]|nr:hypothetical protein [Candidatus Aminicenantes bacterium]